ncbi:MAG: shikimate kinase [Chitinispirillaceae bacterium]|jgi:shikimate kinase
MMYKGANNITLIGMPGSGKSTIGVLLAKCLSLDFIDTDLLIQKRHGRVLQDIVDKLGYLKLREFEEETILSLCVSNTVIATGGSAVYSEKTMHHLRKNSRIIFLRVEKETLLRRIDNFETRGLAKAASQSFDELFFERTLLYEEYGELVIDCDKKGQEEILREIIVALHDAPTLRLPSF